MYQLEDLLPAYEQFLYSQKHRPRGVKRYLYALRRFFEFLGTDATMDDITQESIADYRLSIAHMSSATIGNELTSIRSFCRWGMEKKLRADDPTAILKWPRRSRPVPRCLSTEALQHLITVLKEPDDISQDESWYWQRNRRAIFLMLYGGLRQFEVAALRWKNIDLHADTPYMIVRDGKGGDDRVVPLHQKLLAELRRVPTDERHPEYAVAGKMNGENLTYRSIEHICDRWLAQKDVNITAHQLRHTFATQILHNGGNIRVIQELLGHKHLSTTERYLMIELAEKIEAINLIPETWRISE